MNIFDMPNFACFVPELWPPSSRATALEWRSFRNMIDEETYSTFSYVRNEMKQSCYSTETLLG